jgi:hypothetical protein
MIITRLCLYSLAQVIIENVRLHSPSGFKVECILLFGADEKGALTFVEKVNQTVSRFIQVSLHCLLLMSTLCLDMLARKE